MNSAPHPAVAADLRRALHWAEYSPSNVKSRFRLSSNNLNPHPDDIPGLLAALDTGDNLDVLLKLFFLGRPVSAIELDKALSPLSLEDAACSHLVHIEHQLVKPRIKLSIFEGMLFASDIPAKQPSPDEVMAISLSSSLLYSLTIRRHVNTVYDLGTGCGVQALHARRYASHVIASDINPRALQYTEFNTLLNECTGMELRTGSLFEPVSTDKFDLIVSNPPFAISPDHQVQYRDSGLPADSFCAKLIQETPTHLRQNGLAILLASWGQHPGEHWSTRITEWLPTHDCDSWIIRLHTSEPADYAAEWNRSLLRQPELHAATIQRWIDYYSTLDFSAINFGAVILRRRTGATWTRTDDIPIQLPHNASNFLEQLLAATDLIRTAASPDVLLSERLVLDDRERILRLLPNTPEAFPVEWATLQPPVPLIFPTQISALTAKTLPYFDGSHTVSEVMARVSQNEGLSLQEAATTLLPRLAILLEKGVLRRTDEMPATQLPEETVTKYQSPDAPAGTAKRESI